MAIRKVIIMILILIPIVVPDHETGVPLSAYIIRSSDGVYHAKDVWFNIPKHKRIKIIDELEKCTDTTTRCPTYFVMQGYNLKARLKCRN
jgi:hypothetical protein